MKRKGKQGGCEVSFSVSGSRIFQLQWLVLIEEQRTAGLPHGEKDQSSEMKKLFQKQPDKALQQITSHRAEKKKKK